MISVYGSSGFIGSRFCKLYPDEVVKQDRDERKPRTKDILYLISTVDNYNVHTNITLDVETNLKVLCEVLDHCRDQDITFNFISSWFVYGEQPLPISEDAYCRPTGFYSITKKAAEDLLISFCRTYGVNYRIMRFGNVMGVGDAKTSSKKNALANMINAMKRDEDVYVYDDGTPTRDVIHVNDVCAAVKLVMEKGNLNEIYNIGSGHPTPIGDIILKAKEYLNSNSEIKSKPAPDFHKIVQAKDSCLDITKLKSLGFQQTISTDDIVRELCIN